SLRVPQTLNELLTRSNRLQDCDYVEQIRHHLARLAGRGLAVHLERRAGQREERYMYLLGSQAGLEAAVVAMCSYPERAAPSGLQADAEWRIAEPETRLSALEERLARREGGA
ncbi:DUF480 domain-containing protein, partial [Pseudomonas aeruginosa]